MLIVVAVKRGRGRPRRYPLPGQSSASSIPAVILPSGNGQTLVMAPLQVGWWVRLGRVGSGLVWSGLVLSSLVISRHFCTDILVDFSVDVDESWYGASTCWSVPTSALVWMPVICRGENSNAVILGRILGLVCIMLFMNQFLSTWHDSRHH